MLRGKLKINHNIAVLAALCLKISLHTVIRMLLRLVQASRREAGGTPAQGWGRICCYGSSRQSSERQEGRWRKDVPDLLLWLVQAELREAGGTPAQGCAGSAAMARPGGAQRGRRTPAHEGAGSAAMAHPGGRTKRQEGHWRKDGRTCCYA
ncbi:hypothetical protein [Cohnella soli]|uniref:Uncharacterized protein n=1 Tax=Cohnella soli TaxID=425005 RepID=A0ABW0HPJ6_9BACL